MASKRAYEFMAKAIGTFIIPLAIDDMDSSTRQVGIEAFIMHLSRWYMDDNPNFDWERFMKAVEQAVTEVLGVANLDIEIGLKDNWQEGMERELLGLDDKPDDGIMTNDL